MRRHERYPAIWFVTDNAGWLCSAAGREIVLSAEADQLTSGPSIYETNGKVIRRMSDCKRRMHIDDFAKFHYVGGLRVTADERTLVYALSTVNMAENRYDTDLWTLDLATCQTRRLTSSGTEGHFDLLDNGDVMFVSGRRKKSKDSSKASRAEDKAAGDTEAEVVVLGYEKSSERLAEDESLGTDLFRIALDGGEATLLAHVPLTVRDWLQLDDNRFLLLARELSDTAAPYATLVDIPFWSNGDTYNSGLRWGIYLLDLGDADSKPALLTTSTETVEGWELSQDRGTVYYLAGDYSTVYSPKGFVRALDLADGKLRDLDAPSMFYQGIALVEGDSKLLLLATDMQIHGLNEEPFVYSVETAPDANGTFRRIVGDDFFADVFNSVGSDCRHGRGREQLCADDSLLYLHSRGDSSWLSRVNSDGVVTDLICDEGSMESFDTRDGRHLYYVAMRENMLPEIYRREIDANGATVVAEERLTSYTDDLDSIELASYESFDFESGGDTLTGYVLRPIGFDPSRRYPGILWVHGGPKCTQGRLLFHELQYLCGLGYFVFFTNPHGAGGRSREFMDIFGHYGEQDFDDLMRFTDEVLERYPQVDADRLAEMGGSYGGFMTNWIIGHTDRFRCANSQRSISNWTSKFGVADIGYYFNNDQTKGDPWDHVERMWNQSPLKYADKCTTPTLFLHSDCDYRCPLDQGLQMFTALQLHGCPTRMVVFKGENHDLSRGGKPQARVRRLAEIANWYARWLKDDPEGEPTLRQ